MIATAYQLAGQATPTRHSSLRLRLLGLARIHGSERRSREPPSPLLLEHFVGLLRAKPETLAGKRDRALLLLGFAGGFRRSELVAINLKDLRWSKDGLLVRIRRSKTDQTGEAAEKTVPFSHVATRCPLLHTQEWINAAGLSDRPLFRRIRKGDIIIEQRLTLQSVSLLIKLHATAAGIDAQRLSGHSLRSEFVMQALTNGASCRDSTADGAYGSCDSDARQQGQGAISE